MKNPAAQDWHVVWLEFDVKEPGAQGADAMPLPGQLQPAGHGTLLTVWPAGQ